MKNDQLKPSPTEKTSLQKRDLEVAIILNKFMLFQFNIIAKLITLVGNIIELRGTVIKKMFISSKLEELIISNDLNKQIWELFAVSKLDSSRDVFTMKDFKNVVKKKIISLLKKDDLEESIRQLEPIFRETFAEDIATLEKILRRKKIFTVGERNKIIQKTANTSASEMYDLMEQDLLGRLVFQCFNSKHTIINNYTFNSIEAFLEIMNEELIKEKNKPYVLKEGKKRTPRQLVPDIKQQIETVTMKKGLSVNGEAFLEDIIEKCKDELDVQKKLTEELRKLFYKGVSFDDFLNRLSEYNFSLTDEETLEIYLKGKELEYFQSEEYFENNKIPDDYVNDSTEKEMPDLHQNFLAEIDQKSKIDLSDFKRALKYEKNEIKISAEAFRLFSNEFTHFEQKKILKKVVQNGFKTDKNKATKNTYYKLVFKQGWRVVANKNKEIIKFYRKHNDYEQDLNKKLI